MEEPAAQPRRGRIWALVALALVVAGTVALLGFHHVVIGPRGPFLVPKGEFTFRETFFSIRDAGELISHPGIAAKAVAAGKGEHLPGGEMAAQAAAAVDAGASAAAAAGRKALDALGGALARGAEKARESGREAIPTSGRVSDEQAAKRTMVDMRNLGTALTSWLTDQLSAGAAGQSAMNIRDVSPTPKSYREIVELLHPSDTFFYIQEVPRNDGWGRPFEVRLSDNYLGARVMSIRSAGRNGRFDSDDYRPGAFGPGSDDIVWSDGYFIRWPQGLQ